MNPLLRVPDLPFVKTTLVNGLEVIVRRDARLPLVAVNLWYHVGSKNEERRQRGFAHLFEHLMFEGSEHYPGDFFKPLQRLGAGVNGSTSADRTNYYIDLPAAHLELALAMESDRMGHLLPALSDAKLRIQKDVVKNEYRQNYANRPYGQVGRLLAEALFPPSHPYSWLTIGVMEEVEAATRDEVVAFFERYYVPSNASLALVGDLDEDRALGLAERYFGGFRGGTRALPPRPEPPRLEAPVVLTCRDRVELERYVEAWHTVPQFHDDDAALVLLGDLLARGRASRLYRKLVLDRRLAQDVAAWQGGREIAGTFGVQVTLRPGQSRAVARSLVRDEIAAIAAHGVGDDEVERVQSGRLAAFVFALDNIGGFGGVADRLNAYNLFLGDPGRITSDLERFQRVTAEEIRRVAQAYLGERPSVALEVIGSKAAVVAAPPVRSEAPAPSAAVAFRPPRPEVLRLGNGMPLWVMPRRDLPIVAGTVAFVAGAAAHPPRQGGLARLTAAMITEGTATRSAVEIAEAAERMGASLASTCGWDGSSIGFQCLSPAFGPLLDLMADLVRHPSFPGSEWERVQGQALAGLRSERDSAESRAYRAFLRAIYGPEEPYQTTVDGDPESVSRLSCEALRDYFGTYYRPANGVWVLAGDIDPEQAAAALDARLGGPAGTAPARPVPPTQDGPPGRRLLLLDRPGAAQAVVRVGHPGISRLDPLYTHALLLNHLVGGQFTSRLNAKLREEKGFTYGVRSHFDCRRGPGPFSASAAVQMDCVDEALRELLAELEAVCGDRPPTRGELEDARRALIEGQARHFETPSALVSRFAGLFLYDLPPDDHTRFAERLEEVTVDSLAEAAVQLIQPESMVAVVVADAAVVADSLERLGWAPLECVGEDAGP